MLCSRVDSKLWIIFFCTNKEFGSVQVNGSVVFLTNFLKFDVTWNAKNNSFSLLQILLYVWYLFQRDYRLKDIQYYYGGSWSIKHQQTFSQFSPQKLLNNNVSKCQKIINVVLKGLRHLTNLLLLLLHAHCVLHEFGGAGWIHNKVTVRIPSIYM